VRRDTCCCATGAPARAVPRKDATIVWWLFGSGLFLTRVLKRLDLRAAADLIGLSAAILSRAERSQPVAVESFLRISDFIGIPGESFLCFTETRTATH
jgi:transcriptional regulator with XRE-family HTH domain